MPAVRRIADSHKRATKQQVLLAQEGSYTRVSGKDASFLPDSCHELGICSNTVKKH